MFYVKHVKPVVRIDLGKRPIDDPREATKNISFKLEKSGEAEK